MRTVTQRRELTREDAGTFEIKTGASVYVIDTQAATVVRVPVRERPGPNFDAAAALRRDQELIRLIDIRACAVGHSMVLLLDVRRDGIVTLRRTTIVESIRRLRTSSASSHTRRGQKEA